MLWLLRYYRGMGPNRSKANVNEKIQHTYLWVIAPNFSDGSLQNLSSRP